MLRELSDQHEQQVRLVRSEIPGPSETRVQLETREPSDKQVLLGNKEFKVLKEFKVSLVILVSLEILVLLGQQEILVSLEKQVR